MNTGILRLAGILILAGLLVEAICLFGYSYESFMVWAVVGTPLLLLGSGLYLWSVLKFLGKKGAL